jgi:transposase
MTPPEGATVLCIDEKPGMQALEQRFPMRPSNPGRLGRKEFEYKRQGTRTLIASYNTRTGEVLGHVGPTRKADDLVAFMEHVAQRHPTGPVYVIWDNLNIHYGPRWTEFNSRHGGRFHFVYTPKHASWVNQIEIWFSILARRVLRHASFRSVDELTARVRDFIERWNQRDAHPFRWTFRGQWRTVPLPRAA